MSIAKRFFRPAQSFTFGELLRLLGQHDIDYRLSAALSDKQAERRTIGDIGGLGDSHSDNKKILLLVYIKKAKAEALKAGETAGMALVPRSLSQEAQQTFHVAVDNPEYAFACLAHYFYPQSDVPNESDITSFGKPIADSAKIGKNVAIGHGVVIGERVSIGDNVRIAAHSVIGDDCVIGSGVGIGAHAVIRCSTIGEDSHIFSGAVIGERGFGLAPAKDKRHLAVPHIGGVVIGKRAEIGSNCAIDRGKFSDTLIGDDVKLDNLVHIAHNVEIGDATIIAAATAIAGSAVIGKGVMMGGSVGISDGVVIGDGAVLTGRAGITSDVAAGMTVGGFPAQPFAEFARSWVKFKQMGKKREDNE